MLLKHATACSISLSIRGYVGIDGAVAVGDGAQILACRGAIADGPQAWLYRLKIASISAGSAYSGFGSAIRRSISVCHPDLRRNGPN